MVVCRYGERPAFRRQPHSWRPWSPKTVLAMELSPLCNQKRIPVWAADVKVGKTLECLKTWVVTSDLSSRHVVNIRHDSVPKDDHKKTAIGKLVVEYRLFLAAPGAMRSIDNGADLHFSHSQFNLIQVEWQSLSVPQTETAGAYRREEKEAAQAIAKPAATWLPIHWEHCRRLLA
jgi:hypothetical protein